MPEEEKKGGAEDTKPAESLEIDGSTYTVDDVKNLKAQQASATQKTQEVAAVMKHINSLDMSVDDYVLESERVYGGVARLVRDGVIDEKLSVMRRVPEKPPGDDQTFDWNNLSVGGEKPKPNVGDAAMKSINDKMDSQNTTINQLQKNNAMLLRVAIASKMISEHDDLTQDDAQHIIDISTSDQSKKIHEHIDEYRGKRKKMTSDIEAEVVKKYNINVEEFNANQLREQDAKGGAGGI